MHPGLTAVTLLPAQLITVSSTHRLLLQTILIGLTKCSPSANGCFSVSLPQGVTVSAQNEIHQNTITIC